MSGRLYILILLRFWNTSNLGFKRRYLYKKIIPRPYINSHGKLGFLSLSPIYIVLSLSIVHNRKKILKLMVNR